MEYTNCKTNTPLYFLPYEHVIKDILPSAVTRHVRWWILDFYTAQYQYQYNKRRNEENGRKVVSLFKEQRKANI